MIKPYEVEGGGWVKLLDRWYIWPTVIVEGGGLGGLGRGWVILLDRWYFWPTVVRPSVSPSVVFFFDNAKTLVFNV